MLMRGRVQHPGRLMRFKNILQQAFVPHIPGHGNYMPGKALLAQLLVYIEQRGIVIFNCLFYFASISGRFQSR